MARTVNAAFTQFVAESINLDAGRSDLAKSSRNWLVDRLHEFPSKDSYFPLLYSEKDTFFGSFDRKTKKIPLDDIDLMTCLTAMGAFYIEYIDRLEITVPDTSINLKRLCHDHSMVLNSIRVINKFISLLDDIPQYEKADIKRNYEAATLQLSSYEWNFDIVPCFFTVPDIFGKTYYVIPDGKGHWKKTDPRIDKNRVTTVNQNHEGRILNRGLCSNGTNMAFFA